MAVCLPYMLEALDSFPSVEKEEGLELVVYQNSLAPKVVIVHKENGRACIYNDIYSLSPVAVCVHTALLPYIHTFRGNAWLMPIDMPTDGTKISFYQYFSVNFYLLSLHFIQAKIFKYLI